MPRIRFSIHNAHKNGKIKDEEDSAKRGKKRTKRERECVVGRTFWFVARLLDAFLPAHHRRDDDDDTTRLDERDFLCGMNFFLFFGQKK